MNNPLIGQILGSVLGGGMRGAPPGGATGSGLPGGLGGILGSVLGGGGLGGLRSNGAPADGHGGNRTAMLALMLPLVMAWVRRKGGVGNVLGQVQQQGYGDHADSWLSTGQNQALPRDAAHQLLGDEELSSLSTQLGVGRDEAAAGFSELLPEVVDQLSPQGHLPDDADQQLDAGQSTLERMLQQSP